MEWVLTDKEEFRQIKSKVDAIHLANILEAYTSSDLSLKKTGKDGYMALCPYHGERKRSLKITPHGCRCFSCGFSADTYGAVIPLLRLRYGKDFSKEQAILQIACDENIITKETFERLSGFSYEFKKREISHHEDTISVKTPEELSIQTKVYERMASLFELSEVHKEHLLNVRFVDHLSDYFTFDEEKVESVLSSLKETFSEDILSSIPGFYRQRLGNGRWVTKMFSIEGLGILIRDASGNVRAIQIRSDKETDNKYMFLSCSIKRDDFISGGSVGTPVNVIYPNKITDSTPLAIVEGHFKAVALAKLGYIAFSVQGVYNFREIPKEIQAAENKLNRHFSAVEIFYDADMFSKMAVFGALIRLLDYLSSKRCDLKREVVIWDQALGKGIDDMIFAGYFSSKRVIPAERLLNENTDCCKAAAKMLGTTEEKLLYLSKEERKEFSKVWSSLMKGVFFNEKAEIVTTPLEDMSDIFM